MRTLILGTSLWVAGISCGFAQDLPSQLTLCTTVENVVICDNGASVLTVDRDIVIYNPPPVAPRPPAPPWIK